MNRFFLSEKALQALGRQGEWELVAYFYQQLIARGGELDGAFIRLAAAYPAPVAAAIFLTDAGEGLGLQPSGGGTL